MTAAPAALALLLALAAGSVHANGCIIVRPTASLSFTPQDGHESMANTVDFGLAYRYYYSFRHFRGDQEEPQRVEDGTDVRNEVHVVDYSATWWLSDAWRVSAGIPYQQADRSSLYEHDGLNRHTMSADGFGDMRVMAYYELLGGSRRGGSRGVTIGLGAKLPTGDPDAKDYAYTASAGALAGAGIDLLEGMSGQDLAAAGAAEGATTTRQERNVDQSIQPGDGGTGAILELQAFTNLFWDRAFLFATASYLANPKNTNGVATHRSRANESVMSVPDSYQARLGVTGVLSYDWGLSLDLGYRAEGVPAEDVWGGSDGFRRPGYVIYVEPGLNWQWRSHRLGFSVPIAQERNRTRSVQDRENGTHGDAAFADYLILGSYGYRW